MLPITTKNHFLQVRCPSMCCLQALISLQPLRGKTPTRNRLIGFSWNKIHWNYPLPGFQLPPGFLRWWNPKRTFTYILASWDPGWIRHRELEDEGVCWIILKATIPPNSAESMSFLQSRHDPRILPQHRSSHHQRRWVPWVAWLVGWLVGWLVSWLVGWL